MFDKGFVHLPVSPCIWTRKSRYDIRKGRGAGTNGGPFAFNIKVAVDSKEGVDGGYLHDDSVDSGLPSDLYLAHVLRVQFFQETIHRLIQSKARKSYVHANPGQKKTASAAVFAKPVLSEMG